MRVYYELWAGKKFNEGDVYPTPIKIVIECEDSPLEVIDSTMLNNMQVIAISEY